MLLSLREMVVWLGIGPFEAFIHSLGGLVFVLLLTLKVEGALDSSWYLVFSPLYVALAMDAYFHVIQCTRFLGFIVNNKTNIKFFIFHVILLVLRIGLILYLEIILANFLEDGSSNVISLVPPLLLSFFYLVFRLLPIVKQVRSID